MRSSYYPTGKGKEEFSADENDTELEPLLEEDSAFDGMDDIDMDEVATEKVSQLPPDLLEQIHDAIQRITLAESKFSQPQSYISNLRKFRIYLSLTLVTGITAIVAPSIAFTAFRQFFVRDWNETSLPHEIELLNDDYQILAVRRAQYDENYN